MVYVLAPTSRQSKYIIQNKVECFFNQIRECVLNEVRIRRVDNRGVHMGKRRTEQTIKQRGVENIFKFEISTHEGPYRKYKG